MLSQLGDVYAHFGKWQEAGQMWCDTLDTILGPYNAIETWHQEIESMSSEAIFQTYGIHHILMAGGVILGKLIRCFSSLLVEAAINNWLHLKDQMYVVLTLQYSCHQHGRCLLIGSSFMTTLNIGLRL